MKKRSNIHISIAIRLTAYIVLLFGILVYPERNKVQRSFEVALAYFIK